jgi:hypothetical protein
MIPAELQQPRQAGNSSLFYLVKQIRLHEGHELYVLERMRAPSVEKVFIRDCTNKLQFGVKQTMRKKVESY